jgi:hypothetical protein
MRAAAFETIQPNTPLTALPLHLAQTPSRASPILLLALALPAAFAALAPFYFIAAHAAQHTQVFVERPQHSLQVLLAIVAWSLVFGWPIFRRTRRMGSRRDILITQNGVTVTESGFMSHTVWTEPLQSYRGLAHHVRASLSGTRHELLLIHPNPAHSLLLRTADKIAQNEIDSTALLLGCREIAPQVFYRNTQTAIQRHLATITPQLPSTEAGGAILGRL